MSELERLRSIKTFPSLVKYLRDELDWPIEADDFEDLTFDYEPEELGIDAKTAAKIEAIKQLRPLVTNQPWGIFFVKFEPKRLPVVALRRILSQLVIKKRASSRKADQPAWHLNDLLFISNYGEGEERQITFAHFSQVEGKDDLPTLKVLGWDNLDTPLHLDHVAELLTTRFVWPDDEDDVSHWREAWCSAFTLRHREVITTSRDLSIRLAELARSIRDRIKTVLSIETKTGPLTILMKAFQEALVHDLDASGFADMYAQTIAYGLLSARITNPKANTADGFAAQLPVTNPFLKELLETFLHVGGRKRKAGRGSGIDFDELGVSEVVELLDDANMEAVVRDFGDRNPQEDPVINFYELFLAAYDKQQKVKRGVFYTPRPVVSYIVRSVDELLRTEFGLADGLADTTTWGEMVRRHKDLKIPNGVLPEQAFVQILDPATGTGTFLVEVIDLVHKTVVAKWKAQGHGEKKIEALWNAYVPKHLLPRLHGYELLMAPYAIAHLKIGLKLYETGYRFGSNERARIYLTNTLEPPLKDRKQLELIPAFLSQEGESADEVKARVPIAVVIGNPPYAYQSENKGLWISELIRPYYQVDGKPLDERNPRGLSDDYVKFMRYAEWKIGETGTGLLAYITNHGYINNPTFRGMRQSLLHSFLKQYIFDLHGSTKRKEISPDGSEDKNVFDILPGVAIGIFIKNHNQKQHDVYHSDLWGARSNKYSWLSSQNLSSCKWVITKPEPPFYLFVPRDINLLAEYMQGLKITDVMPVNNVGMVTARDDLTMRWSREEAWNITTDFSTLRPDDARVKYHLGEDSRDWTIKLAQADIKASGPHEELIVQSLYRPFDIRHTYYTGKTKGLHSYPRNELMCHMLGGKNLGLITNRQVNAEFRHAFCSQLIIDKCTVSLQTREASYLFPLYLYPDASKQQNFADTHVWPVDSKGRVPNLSPDFVKAIEETISLHFDPSGADSTGLFTPEDVFHYIYAIMHSQTYRNRYSEFLKSDFPRIPLPGGIGLFRNIIRLGSELVSLHLMESPKLDHLITAYTGPKKPKVERVGWCNDTIWLDATVIKKGQPAEPGTVGFRGVPEDVWNFHIGGYQVCEKWLKDRKGRTLSKDDIAHYQKIVLALNETIRIMGEIDDVIDEHGGWPGAFK